MKFHRALPWQPWILLAMHKALVRSAKQNVHVYLFGKLGQSPHLTVHLHYLPHKAIWIHHLESQLFVQKNKNLPSWATKPIIKFICSLSMTDDNIQHWYLHFSWACSSRHIQWVANLVSWQCSGPLHTYRGQRKPKTICKTVSQDLCGQCQLQKLQDVLRAEINGEMDQLVTYIF